MSVEHVVVLMLENRSFDHMLGLMPGVNGVLGKGGKPDPKYTNSEDLSNPQATSIPVTAGAAYAIPAAAIGKSGFGGPSHSYPSASLQCYGSQNGPTSAQLPQPAPMNGFVASYVGELRSGAHVSDANLPQFVNEPMTAFTGDQLSVLWTLAREFCVCDQWYSEVPGPTEPNRLFVHAATSQGFTHNVWSHPITARTVYEELDGVNKTWAFYYYDLSDSDSFPALKSRTECVRPFSEFFDKATSGQLPNYSFLCPRYSDSTDGFANSQHAPYDVRYGEALIAQVYNALRASSLWEKTLLIVTYDEHGGYFDHVPPPVGVPNPDGLTSPTAYDKQEAASSASNAYLLQPDYQFDFTRMGCRVPTVLVSPWIAKGHVDSRRYQHTSILATVRALFGTKALTQRDAAALSFEHVFRTLHVPRVDTPQSIPVPSIGTTTPTAADMQQPLTDMQKEKWPQLAHLDGHPDSGKVTPPPATRAEGARYIAERRAAHDAYHARHRTPVHGHPAHPPVVGHKEAPVVGHIARPT